GRARDKRHAPSRTRPGTAAVGGRPRHGAPVHDRRLARGLGLGAAAVAPGDGGHRGREPRGRDDREGAQVRRPSRRENRGFLGGAGRGRYGEDVRVNYRTLTRYPPSPSSNPHSATNPRSSPCSRLFTSPRNTGPPAEPFPFPVMMWTTAPGVPTRAPSRTRRPTDRTT